MNAAYQESMEKVRLKQEEIQASREYIQKLEAELLSTRNKIDNLQNQKEVCEQRCDNAKQLLSLLGDEGKRWEQSVREMENDKIYFKGNVFLAASSLSYVGPFTGKYRDELIKEWQNECRQRSLEISPKYSLVNTLGNQI